MCVAKCRSYLEEAEDMLCVMMLCVMSQPVHNVSRVEAVRLSVQRREIAPELRKEAEQILLEWDGGAKQVEAVFRMWNRYASVMQRAHL